MKLEKFSNNMLLVDNKEESWGIVVTGTFLGVHYWKTVFHIRAIKCDGKTGKRLFSPWSLSIKSKPLEVEYE